MYLNNNSLTALPYDLLQWSQLDTLEFNNNPLVCTCDLYEIAGALSGDITRNQDGPTCSDPATGQPLQVYSLTRDICEAKVLLSLRT
jgi:hypothetical protein